MGAAVLEQVKHRWEGGALDEDGVAGPQQRATDEVEGVHRTVDDDKVVRAIRPVPGQHLTQLREDGVVEIARRCRSAGQLREHGSEVRQQLSVRHAGRQVEAHVGLVTQGPGVASATASTTRGHRRAATTV